MSSILLMVGSFVGYIIAYRLYGRWLGHKIFEMSNSNKTPAHINNDGMDFVPTHKEVLFGHHYTSIAGTGPIVGPALAIIWGWVPAVLWIFFGSIFMGAVHDFGALMLSCRYNGNSIGDISGKLISGRVRYLFLLIIFLLLLIVIAIFALVIASLFNMFPKAIIPIWSEIPIAIGLGWIVTKKSDNLLLWSIVAVVLMFVTVIIGAYVPKEIFKGITIVHWSILLFVYAYIASILPVNTLLQPRDYINSHQLFVLLFLMILGVFFANPEIIAPKFNSVADAPSIFPMLFITLACGAISGFHSLVATGTTVKQLDKEHDALRIGYGSMLLEGFLAILVIISVGAGLGMGLEDKATKIFYEGQAAFNHHYSSWAASKGLAQKIGAFIYGASNMLSSLGIPKEICLALLGVFVASFAGTTLDTATRLQRFIIGELFSRKVMPEETEKSNLENGKSDFEVLEEAKRVSLLDPKLHLLTFLAVGTGAALAFVDPSGKGGLVLWPLFGAGNQLLAGLTLLMITVYLAKKQKPLWITMPAFFFLLIVTGWAMTTSIPQYFANDQLHLVIIASVILLLETWIVAEASIILLKSIKENKTEVDT